MKPCYDLRSGAAGVQALLAALYPCSKSPSGQHQFYTATGPCLWCKRPQEPAEAGDEHNLPARSPSSAASWGCGQAAPGPRP